MIVLTAPTTAPPLPRNRVPIMKGRRVRRGRIPDKKEVNHGAFLTRRNGGEASLQEVADAWKREDHNIGWSTYESDEWAVEFAKKIQRELKETHLREAPPTGP